MGFLSGILKEGFVEKYGRSGDWGFSGNRNLTRKVDPERSYKLCEIVSRKNIAFFKGPYQSFKCVLR